MCSLSAQADVANEMAEHIVVSGDAMIEAIGWALWCAIGCLLFVIFGWMVSFIGAVFCGRLAAACTVRFVHAADAARFAQGE